MITKLSKKHFQLIVLFLAASLLGGCITEEDSCKDIVETAGEPDLTTSPVFTAATVTQNNTVNVDISVDDETLEGTVFLLPVDSQDVADAIDTVPFVTVNPGVAETVTVTLTIATPPLSTYYPAVILCDPDVATCTTGAGYVEDISGLLTGSGSYVRGTANGGTLDLFSLKDSCVDISTIDVI